MRDKCLIGLSKESIGSNWVQTAIRRAQKTSPTSRAMRGIRYWYCLACVLVIAVERAAAEYRFDAWTADSGLPQNSVRAIVQTHDGYLWVGTLDGLARFDGVRFTVFNKANAPGLSSTRIQALYEDRQGALWIGLDDGALVSYQAGRFTRFGTQHGLPGTHIQTISGDKQGNLWVTALGTPLKWMNDQFRPELPENIVNLFSTALAQGHRGGIQWALSGDAL